MLLVFNCVWKADRKNVTPPDNRIEPRLKSIYQSFSADSRVVYSEIIGIDGEFIKIKSNVLSSTKVGNEGLATSTTKFGVVEYIKHGTLVLMLSIEPNGNSFPATLADLSIGDKVVINMRDCTLKRIFIIKD